MHPMPIRIALDWWKNNSPRTKAELDSLITTYCERLDFPVTNEHREAAFAQYAWMMEKTQ